MPWTQAVVVCVAIAAVTLLAVLHSDPTAVMTVILIVLGGLGYGQLSAIREQTNGTNSQLLAQVAEHSRILAKLAGVQPTTPPPADEPPST